MKFLRRCDNNLNDVELKYAEVAHDLLAVMVCINLYSSLCGMACFILTLLMHFMFLPLYVLCEVQIYDNQALNCVIKVRYSKSD